MNIHTRRFYTRIYTYTHARARARTRACQKKKDIKRFKNISNF